MACPRGRVEEEVLRHIRPGPEDRARAERVARKALRIVEEAMRRLELGGYVARIEGSYAKDTWLRDSLEIDLFILFRLDVCREVVRGFAERLAPVLEEMGISFELRYAQHPYVRIHINGVPVEIVPGCRVEKPGEVVTPVDRTPFHTEAVRKLLGPEERDEVRLLKSFLKGVGVYGAEIAVQGFSGYVAELLVAVYKCFRSVLEAAAFWRPPVEVAVPGTEEWLPRLRRRYPGSAMLLPDPVDPERNAAAAVSRRSLGYLVLAAAMYLEEPRPFFFHVHVPRLRGPPVPSEWGLRLAWLAAVEAKLSGPLAPDNAWGLARRLASLVERILSQEGFNTIYVEPYAWPEEARIAVFLEVPPAGELGLRRGPPAWELARAMRFIEKHGSAERTPWLDSQGVLAAVARRRFTSAADALEARLPGMLPGSISRRLKGLRVLRGAQAAWLAAEAEPRWAWMLARGSPHWMLRRG